MLEFAESGHPIFRATSTLSRGCEEYETFHDRTGQPVVGVQFKTEVLWDCDDFARKDLLLQQNGKRIEKLSQEDKLSKFCMDAGFLNIVEIGQYFMTKDTE